MKQIQENCKCMRRRAIRSAEAILSKATCAYFCENSSASDPHRFNADPNPVFYINPVLDPDLYEGLMTKNLKKLTTEKE